MVVQLALVAVWGCSSPTPPPPAPEPEVAPAPEEAAPPAPAIPAQHAALFQAVEPIPVAPTDKDLVELGRMLYHEKRLSIGQNQSCNSCHVLTAYGVDNLPTSPGSKGALGGRNSPSTFGAFAHVAQFWDGRSPDVEDQAKGPILNPIEMGMKDDKSVVALLETIPGYQEAFARAFPTGSPAITYDNLAKAIGAFERHLVTPSRFDAYLMGDASALSDEEKAGLDLFIATGCTTCHSGQQVGGAMYQKLGLVEAYPSKDLGRYEVTKNDADKYMFKVPSLRNIEKTAPYFHDGSIATLEEAVRIMAKHQLGKELDDAAVGSIVTFLKALTGEIDKSYTAEPSLPTNGPKTPGPA